MRKLTMTVALLLSVGMRAAAQSTSVETFGVVTAQQASGGLGYGALQTEYLDDSYFAAIAASGATHVRIQCPWATFEIQNANNTSGGYAQSPQCAAALTSIATHHLIPTVVAAFGPPNHGLAEVTLSSGAAVGATSLTASLYSGSFANVAYPTAYIGLANLNSSGVPLGGYQGAYQISAKTSPQGDYVNSVTASGSTATIALASAVNLSGGLPASSGTITGCSIAAGSNQATCTGGGFLPLMFGSTQAVIPGAGFANRNLTTSINQVQSGTQVLLGQSATYSVSNVTLSYTIIYTLSQSLYAPTVSSSPTDPSVVAYANYALAMAADIHSRGIPVAEVELWNEPIWTGDPWDNRCFLYDDGGVSEGLCPGTSNPAAGTYGLSSQSTVNFGFAAALQASSPPAGITFTWAGPELSGFASVLEGGMLSQSLVPFTEPATAITAESFHPYGSNTGAPNGQEWLNSCIQTQAALGSRGNWGNCYLSGEPTTSNYASAALANAQEKLINPTYGVREEITETNNLPPAAGMQVLQAQSNLLQFIGYQANGVTPVELFTFSDGQSASDPTFAAVRYLGSGAITPLPTYTVMQGLISDLLAISNPLPVALSASPALASATSYSGTFPLSTAHMLGATPGAALDSDAVFMWQRKTCSTISFSCWFSIPSPTPVAVPWSIPAGMHVSSVIDLVTRLPVAFSVSGSMATIAAVADNPIEMMVSPVSANPASQSNGVRNSKVN